MWEEEEVAWGTSEGRRWRGNTTVVEMVKVDEKKDWSTRLSRGRGEKAENRYNHERSALKRWVSNVQFHYPLLLCPTADALIYWLLYENSSAVHSRCPLLCR